MGRTRAGMQEGPHSVMVCDLIVLHFQPACLLRDATADGSATVVSGVCSARCVVGGLHLGHCLACLQLLECRHRRSLVGSPDLAVQHVATSQRLTASLFASWQAPRQVAQAGELPGWQEGTASHGGPIVLSVSLFD